MKQIKHFGQSFLVILVLTVLFVHPVLAQDFSYESTKTESISKWQRLNTVEKYLEGLEKNMGRL
jgi:hypothetical protein